MAITQEQKSLMGILSGIPSDIATPYLNMFVNTLQPVRTKIISYDSVVDSNQFADLVARGEKGKSLITDGFSRYDVQPDLIDTEITLSPDELTLMDRGEVIYLQGNEMNSRDALEMRKLQELKRAIERRKELMCSQMIQQGYYTLKNGDTVDFGIPTTKSFTYDSTNGFIKGLHSKIREYKRINKEMPTDILVDFFVAEALLEDTKVQDQIYKLGGNVADLAADEKAIIIGKVLGQFIKEMDSSYDEKGTDITIGTETAGKLILLSKNKLYKGYAGIPIKDKVSNKVEMLASDVFVDKYTTERPAQTVYYATSAFTPIVSWGKSIQRYTVNM